MLRKIKFTRTTRTYGTYEKAEQAAEKFAGVDATVVIAAQDGRFSPVFFLHHEDTQFALPIAAAGFHAVA